MPYLELAAFPSSVSRRRVTSSRWLTGPQASGQAGPISGYLTFPGIGWSLYRFPTLYLRSYELLFCYMRCGCSAGVLFWSHSEVQTNTLHRCTRSPSGVRKVVPILHISPLFAPVPSSICVSTYLRRGSLRIVNAAGPHGWDSLLARADSYCGRTAWMWFVDGSRWNCWQSAALIVQSQFGSV